VKKNIYKIKLKEGDIFFKRNLDSYLGKKKIYQKEDYRILDLIRTTKIKPKNILEIGCGPGKKLMLYKKYLKISGNCIGIDLSKSAIKFGKKFYKEIKLYKMSSLEINKINKKFDLVICGFFLYLLDRDEIFKQFDLIYKKINFNKYLIIEDFEPLFNHTNYDNRNKNNLKIFKQSYTDFLISSGLFKLIYKFTKEIPRDDKKKFKSNEYSLSLYQKIDFEKNYQNSI
jgi:SAM-dependent methyltransferase